jgi:hypothetical protein
MARTEPTVIAMNRLRALKELVVNDGRHGQGNPLRCGPTSGPTLHLTPPRTGLRITGERFVAIEVHATNVRFVVQHPIDGAGSPPLTASGREVRGLGQPEGKLSDAESLLDVPREDLTDDLRLGFRDFEMRGNGVTAGHPSVAKGDLQKMTSPERPRDSIPSLPA